MAAALGGQRQSPKVSDAAVKHGGNRRVGRCEQKRTDTDRRPGTGGASAEVQGPGFRLRLYRFPATDKPTPGVPSLVG